MDYRKKGAENSLKVRQKRKTSRARQARRLHRSNQYTLEEIGGILGVSARTVWNYLQETDTDTQNDNDTNIDRPLIYFIGEHNMDELTDCAIYAHPPFQPDSPAEIGKPETDGDTLPNGKELFAACPVIDAYFHLELTEANRYAIPHLIAAMEAVRKHRKLSVR